MSFLKKFKSDPQNLLGPDLTKALTKEINLSGTLLSFTCPPQTAAIPAFIGTEKFDLDREFKLNSGAPQLANLKIFSSGWNFYDKVFMGTGFGGLDIDIFENMNIFKAASILTYMMHTDTKAPIEV